MQGRGDPHGAAFGEVASVDLHGYWRIIVGRWNIVAFTVLSMVAIAAVLTLVLPKKYTSDARFFVSTSSSANTAQLAQGSDFTRARVSSYAQLVQTRTVLGPIASSLNFPGGVEKLADEVNASVEADTVLLDVTVTDRSPARAHRIAEDIASSLPHVIDRLETTGADKASPVNVTVVNEPVIPTEPVSPRPALNVGVGLVVGLLIGVAAAVLRDRFDTLVRSRSDLKDIDVTVLGTVPFDNDAKAHPLVVQSDPRHGRAEAFRSLRTNLRFVDASRHPRTLVITSSVAGEGKTTTTANLALTIAETQASVCLIEGDLRRPRLLNYLGLEGAVGLTDVLIGSAGLSDVLQQFGAHDVAVLGAGALPPNPSELLGSPAMRATLAQLRERFDYVLIDAPPVLPVTDAAVTSTLADGTVFVVGAGVVHRERVSAALELLRNVDARLLGLIVNRDPRRPAARTYQYYAPEPPVAVPTVRGSRRRGDADARG